MRIIERAAVALYRVEAMMRRIVNMQWSMPAGVEISAQVKDLLSKLLVADPAKRLSMQVGQKRGFGAFLIIFGLTKFISTEVGTPHC
jgi:hypothetical protein